VRNYLVSFTRAFPKAKTTAFIASYAGRYQREQLDRRSVVATCSARSGSLYPRQLSSIPTKKSDLGNNSKYAYRPGMLREGSSYPWTIEGQDNKTTKQKSCQQLYRSLLTVDHRCCLLQNVRNSALKLQVFRRRP
jgi:hypothetical protein